MTPAELNTWAGSWGADEERRQERERRSLYNLGAIIRAMVWGKRMPSFEEVFGAGTEEMTDQQMYANVRALNALLGGTEE